MKKKDWIGIAVCWLALFTTWTFGPFAQAAGAPLYLSCTPTNDLYVAIRDQPDVHRFDNSEEAVQQAPAGAGLLILAEGYPKQRTQASEALFAKAQEKNLKVYIEYPSGVPGVTFADPKETLWERLVVSSDSFGKELPKNQIMVAHQCTYLPTEAQAPLLVVARVAGYNTAVYGIPTHAHPILFSPRTNLLVATTKLSQFATGRYAPQREWKAFWGNLLTRLGADRSLNVDWKPIVTPAFPPEAPLNRDMQLQTFKSAVDWNTKSGLMVPESAWPMVVEKLRSGAEVSDHGGPQWPSGDGTYGILEGYASQILPNGGQRIRWPLRADCQAESAMLYALDWALSTNQQSKKIATNLLEFLYVKSGMTGGVRGNPEHPAFGLIGWGAIAPAWEVATYGDDNARTMLATMMCAAALKSDQWDQALLRALLANLRTTGKLGFRGDRVDIGPLEQNGWKHYQDAATVNYSPHFEAYSWACFLWAYKHTGYEPFLEKSKTAIRMTMEAYPGKWRWKDNMERAHLLLGLAWLVRLENTEQHREWARRIAHDLIEMQDKTGALRERMVDSGGGHYQRPASNELYGTMETPLMHEKDDPVSDQLYVAGFALLGFHEADPVLKDAKISEAADKLAGYLCRIQNRSEKIPYLDGSWFRAFDFHRWEAWASSGDAGWGAWSVEAGWAQAWGAAIIGLRLKEVTFWDFTANTKISSQWKEAEELMKRNDGSPWTKK
ncbi:MAG: hypothetical protein ACO1QB_03310 [Verrucomicrobiales bacterium]